MTPQEFAQKIRTKYPNGVSADGRSYAEIDDVEFTKRILQKYPSYRNQVNIEDNIDTTVADGSQPVEEPSNPIKEFGMDVGETFVERGKNIASEYNKTVEAGKKGFSFQPQRSALHIAGEVAGGVGDLTFAGIKLLTPQFIENIASAGVKKVGETEIAQAAFTKYEELKEKHPEAMKDLEAVFNIASIIPVGKGVKVAGEGIEQGVKATTSRARSLFTRPASSVDDVIKQADETLKAASTASETLAKAEAAAPKVSLIEKWADITPDIKKRIEGKHEKLQEYFDIAHARNLDDTVPTPLEYGANRVNETVVKMEELLSETGKGIGSFRKKISTYRVAPDQMKGIEEVFNKQLDRLNLQLKNGSVVQKPGTVARTSAKNDIKVLQELYDDFSTVKGAPNLERLIDLRNAFDRKINFGKSAREVSNSVDPVSRAVRKQIADVAADIVGKTEATQLKKYSEFMDAYERLRSFTDRKAGAEFLLKQVLSERGRLPRETMEIIKEFTGVDLMDDATMASIATDLIGNKRQRGLFEQEITQAGMNAIDILRGDPQGILEAITRFVKDKVANPEKQLLRVSKGVSKK